VGWSGVQVKVILLHVLAVVAFFTVQAKQALFQDFVIAIPKRQRKAKPLVAVAYSGQSVFVPAIGPRAGVIMRKIFPRLSISAVVLANGPSRALAHVWAPASPRRGVVWRFPEPAFFCGYLCHT